MFVKRDLAAWFGRRNDRPVPRNKNAKGSTKIVGKHEVIPWISSLDVN